MPTQIDSLLIQSRHRSWWCLGKMGGAWIVCHWLIMIKLQIWLKMWLNLQPSLTLMAASNHLVCREEPRREHVPAIQQSASPGGPRSSCPSCLPFSLRVSPTICSTNPRLVDRMESPLNGLDWWQLLPCTIWGGGGGGLSQAQLMPVIHPLGPMFGTHWCWPTYKP